MAKEAGSRLALKNRVLNNTIDGNNIGATISALTRNRRNQEGLLNLRTHCWHCEARIWKQLMLNSFWPSRKLPNEHLSTAVEKLMSPALRLAVEWLSFLPQPLKSQ